MKILITSASQPPALALARVLTAEGHTVHGCDEEWVWGTAPARWSWAYTRFHGIRLGDNNAFVRLWENIRDEIDLVIPFSNDLSCLRAVACNAVLSHPLFGRDHEFQDFVRKEIISLYNPMTSVVKVPAAFDVHSRRCIAEILSYYPSTTFELRPAPHQFSTDTDDEDTLVDVSSSRSDSGLSTSVDSTDRVQEPMALSCSTLNDATVEAIKSLNITDFTPYRLIEVVDGGTEYSAHALVNNGRIRTFLVTTPVSNGLQPVDFQLVASSEPLVAVLYSFMASFVEALQTQELEKGICTKDPRTVAMHLTLRFNVKEEIRSGEFIRRITAMGCSNQPHPSLILLCTHHDCAFRQQLAHVYTSSTNHVCAEPLTLPPTHYTRGLSSLPNIICEFIATLLSFSPLHRKYWPKLGYATAMFLVWGFYFKEQFWDWKDPGPALYVWTTRLAKGIMNRIREFWWVRILRRTFRWAWNRETSPSQEGSKKEDKDRSDVREPVFGTFSQSAGLKIAAVVEPLKLTLEGPVAQACGLPDLRKRI